MKAVIFDVDGVLIDSEKYYHQLRMNFFESVGEIPAVTGVNDLVGLSLDDGWKLMAPDPELRARLVPQFIDYWHSHNIDFPKYVNARVPEVLRALKSQNKQLAIASAGVRPEIERMVNECDFTPYFNQIISGEDVVKNKPAPDVYVESVKKLNLTPDDCIAIEDSFNGIKAAKAAGLTVWAIHYPEYSIDQRAADRVFNGFEDLEQYLTV